MRADRKILPGYRHSRSGAGRLLDSPCLAERRNCRATHVVDAASIAISRWRRSGQNRQDRRRRLCFARCLPTRGEPRVCSMVRAPTPEDEDRRRICRERKVLIMERVQHVNRIKGLLFSQGASGYEPLRRDRRVRLEALQTGDGRRLPQHLKAQVCRELDRLELLLEQVKAVEAERDALLNAEQTKASAPPPMLLGVRGVGPEFASVLWSEGLSRHFDNRRQIAAYAGLAPTPWQSGSVNREQGISQSGNSRPGTTMIQLASALATPSAGARHSTLLVPRPNQS